MGRRRRENPYRRPDRFTRQAQAEGFEARSVFKLTEIQRRFRVLKQGDRVVDLGCSPGSWSRWVADHVGARGVVVGVDLVPTEVPRLRFVQGSVHDVAPETLREQLGGSADVVLSDMAPRTTGNVLGDHVAQLDLADRALTLARALLVPGGNLVVKVFDGEDAPAWVLGFRRHFDKTKRMRPEAVRRRSREFFVLGLGFRPGVRPS